MITYSDEQGGYSHPDHIRVHEISVLAFERSGDPEWYPEAGEPWQVLKLYYSSGFSRARVQAMHDWFVGNGEESPYADWVERWPADHADATTTRIDVGEFMDVGRAALLAHKTQVASDAFWFKVPLEVARDLHPWEDFVLARSVVESTGGDGEFETDLFAGVRVPSTS